VSELAAKLDAFRREHPVKTVGVGPLEWSYRAAGTGSEGLIVLPGAVGGWDGVASLLEPLFEDYRVLFVEYPAVSGLDDLLTGLSEILRHEGIERTALLGGSFGGMVAQAFLLRFPERTTGVVLSATGPPDPRRARTNEKFLRLLSFVPMGAVRSLLRLGVRKILKRASRERDLWPYYSGAIDDLTRERLRGLYRIAIDFDRDYAKRIEAIESWPGRMLLIEGSEDRVASKKSREALKVFYPRATRVTLEGAGHGMSLERPEEWGEAVTTHLGRCAEAPRPNE
jgi:3-oxoadipate enol-lactonase